VRRSLRHVFKTYLHSRERLQFSKVDDVSQSKQYFQLLPYILSRPNKVGPSCSTEATTHTTTICHSLLNPFKCSTNRA
jgi:hypothetical protein